MEKVLIAYASFGQGHKSAADGVGQYLDTKPCDLLDFSSPFIKKIYSLSYTITTQYFPSIWQILFSLAKVRFLSYFLDRINSMVFYSFLRHLKDSMPKVVVVTHFFPSRLIGKLKNKLNFKLICIVTDLRVHPVWVSPNVDYYFAAVSQAKEDLVKLGVKKEKIIAGYVPLREGFLRVHSVESLRKKFNTNSRPTILFVSSSGGAFPFLKKSIKSLLSDFNIFVIHGRNNKLKKYLKTLKSPYVRFFSSYDKIWELVNLSSVIIGKPGGLTCFEGISKKKCFVFTHYIPGQEKQNMDLLVNYGIAGSVSNAKELTESVYYFEKKYNQVKNEYPVVVKDMREPLADLIREYV